MAYDDCTLVREADTMVMSPYNSNLGGKYMLCNFIFKNKRMISKVSECEIKQV
jgi:hypothetical protein